MEIKKNRRQLNIAVIIALAISFAAGLLLRSYDNQFAWDRIPYTVFMFFIFRTLDKDTIPEMKDRVKLLIITVGVFVFTAFLFEGFNLEVALYKAGPVLLGGLLLIPLLFAEPLYKKMKRD